MWNKSTTFGRHGYTNIWLCIYFYTEFILSRTVMEVLFMHFPTYLNHVFLVISLQTKCLCYISASCITGTSKLCQPDPDTELVALDALVIFINDVSLQTPDGDGTCIVCFSAAVCPRHDTHLIKVFAIMLTL